MSQLPKAENIKTQYRKICATCASHVGGIVKNNYLECHSVERMEYLKRPSDVPLLESKFKAGCKFWTMSDELKKYLEEKKN
jgi:hypothetical protein